MAAHVQVVSVESPDSDPCVIIATRSARLVFNIGGGSQRAFSEHRIKFTRIEHVFLTHLGAETLGGLPGLILTLADVEKKAIENSHDREKKMELTLHGPPGSDKFLHATRHFMRDDLGTTVDCTQPGATTVFQHEEMTIRQIPMCYPAEGATGEDTVATTTKGVSADPGIGASDPPPTKRPRTGVDGEGTEARGEKVGCICYVCLATPEPGKFDVQKARALGMSPSPLYANLQQGHDVVFDGRSIKASQVVGERRYGAPALIVSCPSLDLIPTIASNSEWEPYYVEAGAGGTKGSAPDKGSGSSGKESDGKGSGKQGSLCVVHMCSAEVLRNPEYQAWSRKFGERATHLVLARPFCSPHTPFQNSYSQSMQLNRVCPSGFTPLRQFAVDKHMHIEEEKGSSGSIKRLSREELDLGGEVIAASSKFVFNMMRHYANRPKLDANECLTWGKAKKIAQGHLEELNEKIMQRPNAFTPATVRASSERPPSPRSSETPKCDLMGSTPRPSSPSMRAPHRVQQVASMQQSAAPNSSSCPVGADRSEIAFLGTGSAVPSNTRNVSGIWVRLSPEQKGSPYPRTLPGTNADGVVEAAGWGHGSPLLETEGSMLLDAGEGTMGQLWRLLGDSPEDQDSAQSGAREQGLGSVAELETAVHAAASTNGGFGPFSSTSPSSSIAHVGVQRALRDLSAVWISHTHADHHLGLLRILSERNKLLRSGGLGGSVPEAERLRGASRGGGRLRNLLLMAPAPIEKWLEEYAEIDPNLRGGYDFLDVSLMTAERNALRPPPDLAAKASIALARAGILQATSVRVNHCSAAYALVLTVASTAAKAAARAASAAALLRVGGRWWTAGGSQHGVDSPKDGADWKLVYSGDCRPCSALIKEGKGAAVLIHEATFDGSRRQEAYDRRHCTVPEALDVATKMKAERVILTHFSQRYPHVPILPRGVALENVTVAFDFMRARIPDLNWMPKYRGALGHVFTTDHVVEAKPEHDCVAGVVGRFAPPGPPS